MPWGEMDDRAESLRREAKAKGVSPASICKSPYHGDRGVTCPGCGTYFRGDDMG